MLLVFRKRTVSCIVIAVLLAGCISPYSQDATGRKYLKPELKFRENGRFRIVQFSDVHWGNRAKNPEKREATAALMAGILDQEKPDLVVLTGDIVRAELAETGWKQVLAPIMDRKIPWVATLGNHDCEKGDDAARKTLVAQLEAMPYSLLHPGPLDIGGFGNMSLKIAGATSKKSEAALYFLDTRAGRGSSGLTPLVVAWYQEQSRRITESNGGRPLPGLAFFHIPLREYGAMWRAKDDPALTIRVIGVKGEQVCSPPGNTGMYAAMRKMGDVMGVFTGHDHANDFIGCMNDGIALAYGRVTGYEAYGKLPRGARVIELKEGKREFDSWILDDKGERTNLVHYPASFQRTPDVVSPVDLKSLLNEMVDRDRVARFPDPTYVCRQFSSYDRDAISPDRPGWFANSDKNQFVRMEESEGRRQFGGGDLNPDLHAPAEQVEHFLDLRLGLSVHWGPSSHGGKEISWARSKKIPKEEYDNYYKQFNPVKFDADQWCELMKQWGLKYVLPTGKHHDGFTLWFSDFTGYDMEQTPFKRDLMKELGEACKKHDILFGSYYSILDWYHPDYEPQKYGGPGELFKAYPDSPNLQRYWEFMENQVTELIRDYDCRVIQFDGEWDKTYTHEVGARMYRQFRKLDRTVILSSRIDMGRRNKDPETGLWNRKIYAGDYEERERRGIFWQSPQSNRGNSVLGWAEHPWQAWVTIDKKQWSWNPNPDLLTAEEMILDMVRTVGNNGNYCINLGPMPDGSFNPIQVELMNEFGKWVHKHAEAIYGTRGGPFMPAKDFVSTHKGNKVFLHLLNGTDKVSLPPIKAKILHGSILGGGAVRDIKQTDTAVEVQLILEQIDKFDTIVVLELEETK